MERSQNFITITRKSFPDNIFRSYLREFYAIDDGVLDISKVRDIDINRKGVKSLKGIELFTELTDLSCVGNELSGINLNKNTKLKYLDCSDNNLAALGVNECRNLDALRCAGNCITRLDVSMTSPRFIDCSDNNMVRLDLGENRRLEELYCSNNHLLTLNVSLCTQLRVMKSDEDVKEKVTGIRKIAFGMY